MKPENFAFVIVTDVFFVVGAVAQSPYTILHNSVAFKGLQAAGLGDEFNFVISRK